MTKRSFDKFRRKIFLRTIGLITSSILGHNKVSISDLKKMGLNNWIQHDALDFVGV